MKAHVIAYIVGVFFWKFTSPTSFILAGFLGYFLGKKPRWVIWIIGVFVAIIEEILLVNLDPIRVFGEGLIIGVLVSTTHAFIGRIIYKKLNK